MIKLVYIVTYNIAICYQTMEVNKNKHELNTNLLYIKIYENWSLRFLLGARRIFTLCNRIEEYKNGIFFNFNNKIVNKNYIKI